MQDMEAMMNGDIDALSKVMSQQLGINKDFIAMVINCMQKNREGIKKNVRVIADLLKVNADLLEAFVDIASNEYNVKCDNLEKIQKVDGQLMLNIKMLFGALFPQIDMEILDGAIQFATQGDPSPLIDIFNHDDIPFKEMF
jgi:hypothetical protein